MINMPKDELKIETNKFPKIDNQEYIEKISDIIVNLDKKDKEKLVAIKYRPKLNWKLIEEMIYIVPKKDNKLDEKLYLEWVNLIESKEDVDMEEYLDVITNISISSNQSDVLLRVNDYFKELEEYNDKYWLVDENESFYDSKGKQYNPSNFDKDLQGIKNLSKAIVIRENLRNELELKLGLNTGRVREIFSSRSYEEAEIIGNRIIQISKFISKGDLQREIEVKKAVFNGIEEARREMENRGDIFYDKIYFYLYNQYLFPHEGYKDKTGKIILLILLIIVVIIRLLTKK